MENTNELARIELFNTDNYMFLNIITNEKYLNTLADEVQDILENNRMLNLYDTLEDAAYQISPIRSNLAYVKITSYKE